MSAEWSSTLTAIDERRARAGGFVCFALPAASLAWREGVRFVRQPSRVLGGLATPLVFWLLLGSGIGRSFSVGDGATPGGYAEYFFTGSVVLIVLFTAVFSTISTIEDRREGFLQSVIVSPAPRAAIAAGKVLGAAALATVQAMVFVCLAPAVGLKLTPATAVSAAAVLFGLSLGLAGLGLFIAWSMDSTQGFHAVMNLLLMPMWMLSGAVFPASGAARWLVWIMAANPLTYGVAALRQTLEGHGPAFDPSAPGLVLSLGVTAAFVVVTVSAATWRVAGCKVNKGQQ